MSEKPSVLIAAEEGVLLVTINRPEARNAVDRAVAEGIAAAMDRLDGEGELRVGILTGAGDTFSAGMDLKAFARGEVPVLEGRGFAGLAQRGPRKPLIAAVEGNALAGGMEIALACDLIVAAESARFGIPEVRRGLVAAGGALLRLPRRIPYHQAMLLALSGEPIPATRAFELGLVSELAPAGEAVARARAVAGQIVAGGPLAIEATKQIVQQSGGWDAEEAWTRQGELAGPVFVSEDAREGALSFAEKRPPRWQGR